MTASLFRSLGGWTPDVEGQAEAVRLGLAGNAEAAVQALERLGVPDPDLCARHLAALGANRTEQQRAELGAPLARSVDPAQAAQALSTRLSQPEADWVSGDALATLVAVASQSRFLGRYLGRNAAAVRDLTRSGALTEPREPDEFQGFGHALLAEHGDALAQGETQAFALALRERRRLELARIFYREVLGLGTVDVSCGEVADLADALIDAAYRAARMVCGGSEAGPAHLRMSIIGLGKLGSRELNFSSDIDILYIANDAVLGSSALATMGEAVARTVRELLDTPLQAGRVFRVDLRLRPDGTRGPLLATPRGLLEYYARIARTWERAALLRARVVAGEPEPGAEALALLEPIRHPRSVDPSVVDELRDMKERIDRHESWRTRKGRLARGWDSKVGRGGIREIEFVVAAFQILLAGRHAELRGLSTFSGLGRLAAGGFLDPADANDLLVAYRFYRLLEHRLQMDEDRQTQRLPTQPVELLRLARRLGFADWTGLDQRLEGHRNRVREIFERMLLSQPTSRAPRKADELLDSLTALMVDEAERDAVLAALEEAGFARPRSALGALQVLWRRPTGPFSAQALRSADQLAAYLLEGALASPDPDAAIVHLTDLLTHPHADPVVNFLRAKPATLRSVMTLFGASDFLARRLSRNPHWIDRLLSSPRVLQTRSHLEEAWGRVAARGHSLEHRLELLRRFHAGQVVRIAMAYLEAAIDDRQLADQLTLLAELAVEQVVVEARRDLGQAGLMDFSVIAMGRFGGLEMGFGSDLDLIFVFDDAPEAAARYGRLARRLIHFLNIPMPAGILYHVDLRLRPYGGDGTVVTTLARFADYQRNEADPWERVALLRGRPVTGPKGLRKAFREVVRTVVRLSPDELAPTIRRLDEIRQRLLSEVARPKPGSYHLKYGSGGLIEVELLAQIRRLVHQSHHGESVGEPRPRILDIFEWLVGAQGIPEDDARDLSQAYTFYRRLQNVLRLTQDRSVDQIVPADPNTKRVRPLMSRHDPELSDSSQLEARLVDHLQRVHAIYQRTLNELTEADVTGGPS